MSSSSATFMNLDPPEDSGDDRKDFKLDDQVDEDVVMAGTRDQKKHPLVQDQVMGTDGMANILVTAVSEALESLG
ncbi:MAG: hypothetical protein M1819_004377 [Sarea resinae]|nr:MAG: hypothetical protein M1819_004377 [Sarea resinae]